MQNVISTGEGSCTGVPSQPSYSYPPKPFNLFFMNIYSSSVRSLASSPTVSVSFFGTSAYKANSLVNSYNNAFTLPTVYSYQLSLLTGGLSSNLAQQGLSFFPTKTCYDSSTQSQVTCSLTDYQCVVRFSIIMPRAFMRIVLFRSFFSSSQLQ